MPALQVKDCPSDVYESLRICAAEENRSISQQVLTIIQQYLKARASNRTMASAPPASHDSAFDNTDYKAKRAKAFKRIENLPPLPVSPTSPAASDLLARIRDEEAL